MDVKTAQLHHERRNTKPYKQTDHRVELTVCAHTRYFDENFPVTGRCLDCGHIISYDTWQPLENDPGLNDSDLAALRAQYNSFWGVNLLQSEMPKFTALQPHEQAVLDALKD